MQVCVVRQPEDVVPLVANWVFVDAASGDLFNIDSFAGVWTRTKSDETEPYRAGVLDTEIAAVICRAVYEAHHPNQAEH